MHHTRRLVRTAVLLACIAVTGLLLRELVAVYSDTTSDFSVTDIVDATLEKQAVAGSRPLLPMAQVTCAGQVWNTVNCFNATGPRWKANRNVQHAAIGTLPECEQWICLPVPPPGQQPCQPFYRAKPRPESWVALDNYNSGGGDYKLMDCGPDSGHAAMLWYRVPQP